MHQNGVEHLDVEKIMLSKSKGFFPYVNEICTRVGDWDDKKYKPLVWIYSKPSTWKFWPGTPKDWYLWLKLTKFEYDPNHQPKVS